MLEIRNLSSGYPGNPVLTDISLSVRDGSFTAVIGPNGCGKSTLLRAIAGILPSSGEILLNQESLNSLPSQQRAQKIAFLPQTRPIPEITARRLVLHARFPYLSYPRHYRSEDLRIAQEAMAQMDILPLADRSLPTLSGGERQKVYISMLLAQQTPVVLMDEPTSYLDISHKFDVIRLAQQLKQAGKTVIMVLHDLDLALNCADGIVLMQEGCIRLCAPPDVLYQSGAMEEVFQIQVRRMETDTGFAYFFRPVHADR